MALWPTLSGESIHRVLVYCPCSWLLQDTVTGSVNLCKTRIEFITSSSRWEDHVRDGNLSSLRTVLLKTATHDKIIERHTSFELVLEPNLNCYDCLILWLILSWEGTHRRPTISALAIFGCLSGSTHMASFLPSAAMLILTVSSRSFIGWRSLGSEKMMSLSNRELKPTSSGVLVSSKACAIFLNAVRRTASSWGVHYGGRQLASYSLGKGARTWPYWILHKPFARSGSRLRTWRRVTNFSDVLPLSSSTASTRSWRALLKLLASVSAGLCSDCTVCQRAAYRPSHGVISHRIWS